jgi:hypothetical protein
MSLTPSPGFRVTMMLADHVAQAEGKLYIAGGGWTLTGPGAAPSAIAVLIGVPWTLANTKIAFKLALVQQDGEPVQQVGPVGQAPVEIAGELEVGRPAGVKPGTPLDVPLAINVPPLALASGQRFTWNLTLNGESADGWHLSFGTRTAPGSSTDPTALPPV